jgi:uncharacterized protein
LAAVAWGDELLHLVLKASTACNAGCLYCVERFRGGSGAQMPLDVVEQVLARADEYLNAHPEEEIEFLWHGGEPLLCGPEYYNRVYGIQRVTCPETTSRIRHGLQSNLTCLTEEFIPPLRQLGIVSVGTSYDPGPRVRGLGSTRDSDSYNRRSPTWWPGTPSPSRQASSTS